MQRIPEPEELMEGEDQATAYALADFSEPNRQFLDHYQRCFPSGPSSPDGQLARVLDLGCGPADIPMAFALDWPRCHITAVDGAEAMLAHGRRRLLAHPAAARIELVCDYLPDLAQPERTFDTLLSNSLLHHLPHPEVLWDSLLRFGRPGAQVLIMDLFRPPSTQRARELQALHAADEAGILQRDFYNSLLAAFEPDEVETQLAATGLDCLQVQVISDRHLLVSGHLPERP